MTFRLPDWVNRIHINDVLVIDPLAGLVIILLTLIAVSGSKKLAHFNTAVTIVSVLVILFVIVAGTVSYDNFI